jgi:hypothetical protein
MTRELERSSCPRSVLARTAVAAALALACALIAAPRALATAPLSWSAAAAVPGAGALASISCASESLCVTVSAQGRAFTTTDPSSADPLWTQTLQTASGALTSVSCAAGALCVAVDAHDAFVTNGGFGWTTVSGIDGASTLAGVSCPSAGLCVAVDEAGNVLSSTNPASSRSWHLAHVDSSALTGVSCASSARCVAVGATGGVLASTNPASLAATWTRQLLDGGTELTSVSCVPGSETCVAGDAAGSVFATQDAAFHAPTWSFTPLDSARLEGVSCASSRLCVAVDARGAALASDGPTAPVPGWVESSAETGRALSGVWCEPGGFCVAVDREGRSLLARVPAPQASTAVPALVRDTSATLSGVVNPNDAVLGACAFEYGTGVPYSQSVPCSVLPVPAGGAQAVSAEVGSLAPNRSYHYRLVASDAEGASAGADVTFTTAVTAGVPLAYPHPSLTGNPAVGQKLTCHPNLTSSAEAQLTYAWLRDLVPIAGAGGSTYAVKGQDSGHHLQCQVTAANAGGSVTARSAFVTIPRGGVPASVGETLVGRARFAKGRVNLPVTCSARAFSGCRITLRVTVVEALSGRRVVAVSAVRFARHSRAAGLRHSTITLAGARARLARGSHRTVSAALNSRGRRLIAARRRFTATVSVSGTVIGVIESTLSHQTLVLRAGHGKR